MCGMPCVRKLYLSVIINYVLVVVVVVFFLFAVKKRNIDRGYEENRNNMTACIHVQRYKYKINVTLNMLLWLIII